MRTLRFIFCAVLACLAAPGVGAAAGEAPELVPIETGLIRDKGVGFAEPSGLSLALEGDGLLSVSDDTAALFRLDADGAARRAGEFDVPATELEGVALDAPRDRIVAVREEGNEVLVFAVAGGAPRLRRALSEMQGWDAVSGDFAGSGANKGLEGVTVDAATGVVFVLKEGRPRMMLALSPELDRILDHRRLDPASGFAVDGIDEDELDVSGLAHDAGRGLFWIVSAEGRVVFLYDWDGGRAVQAPLRVMIDGKDKAVKKAEGVALDPATNRLHVVTDHKKRSRRVVYELRDAAR